MESPLRQFLDRSRDLLAPLLDRLWGVGARCQRGRDVWRHGEQRLVPCDVPRRQPISLLVDEPPGTANTGSSMAVACGSTSGSSSCASAVTAASSSRPANSCRWTTRSPVRAKRQRLSRNRALNESRGRLTLRHVPRGAKNRYAAPDRAVLSRLQGQKLEARTPARRPRSHRLLQRAAGNGAGSAARRCLPAGTRSHRFATAWLPPPSPSRNGSHPVRCPRPTHHCR